jgi:hypothetical protein
VILESVGLCEHTGERRVPNLSPDTGFFVFLNQLRA